MKISLQERFERKVIPEPNSGCHLWMGSCNRDESGGHGRFRIGTRGVLAHRTAYEIYCGPIPSGMQVCHCCDTPSCVNPDHLFLGMQQDNICDMIAKGRSVSLKKEQHGMAVLNEEKVFEIRWLSALGFSRSAIANMYGVTKANVNHIVHGRTWQMECQD